MEQSRQHDPSPGEDGIEFLNPADDTPENRAIVELVEERSSTEATPQELDDVITELGYDPAEFSIAD